MSISASNITFWWGGLGGYESHWLPVGQGVDGEVRAIKFRGSYGDWPIWVGGNFTTETNPDGSILSSHYAAIRDRNAHQWIPKDRGLDGLVNSIQRLRGDGGYAVVPGGEFTHAVPQIEEYNHIIIHDLYGATTFNEHRVVWEAGPMALLMLFIQFLHATSTTEKSYMSVACLLPLEISSYQILRFGIISFYATQCWASLLHKSRLRGICGGPLRVI